jgi:hypothetical protein
MVNEKFETIHEPGKFGNHAASRKYYVHGRFVRKKTELILQTEVVKRTHVAKKCLHETGCSVMTHIFMLQEMK